MLVQYSEMDLRAWCQAGNCCLWQERYMGCAGFVGDPGPLAVDICACRG